MFTKIETVLKVFLSKEFATEKMSRAYSGNLVITTHQVQTLTAFNVVIGPLTGPDYSSNSSTLPGPP